MFICREDKDRREKRAAAVAAGWRRLSLAVFAAIFLLTNISGCAGTARDASGAAQFTEDAADDGQENAAASDQADEAENPPEAPPDLPEQTDGVSPGEIPAYSGAAYAVINGNVPYFTKSDCTEEPFEQYSAFDALGRCGAAFANICEEIMPTEERGPIGHVRPSGWHTVKYDNVDGNYLYNRCHLIGYQLAGENANEQNLITGTRYLNTEGMLPFENQVADYVRATGHHVLYRVTPVFTGDNLLADGVLMEAWSVEDNGAGVCFNVFAYNVQPGIGIDFATGESWQEEGNPSLANADAPTDETLSEDGKTVGRHGPGQTDVPQEAPDDTRTAEYILNTNTMKFHYPTCESVHQMSGANRQEYVGTREELIAKGYDPCGRCQP